MFRKTILASIALVGSLALAACQPGPANNAATANGTGPSTASGGAPTGGTCGGIANIQCGAATDFCERPTGQCGTADAQGTCTTRPEVCTRDYVPVCGCDGRTYGNACEARMAGMSVQAAGECPGTGAAANATNTAEANTAAH